MIPQRDPLPPRTPAPPAVRGEARLVGRFHEWLSARRTQPWVPLPEEFRPLAGLVARPLPPSVAAVIGASSPVTVAAAVRLVDAEGDFVDWIRRGEVCPGAGSRECITQLIGHTAANVPPDVADALGLKPPCAFAQAARRARELLNEGR